MSGKCDRHPIVDTVCETVDVDLLLRCPDACNLMSSGGIASA